MKTLRTKLSTKVFVVIIPFMLLFSTSCGDNDLNNIKIPGVTGPKVNIVRDNVVVTLVFETLRIDAGARFPIPNYEHSYVEVSPDLKTGGTMMVASISLQDVFFNDLLLLPKQTLPGGRPLPGVVGGELPAVAFNIPEFHNMTFYIGNDFYGIFFPFHVGVKGVIATFRFYQDGDRIGHISLVGADENNENAGFLLLLDLSPSMKKRLKRLAEYYR